MKDAARIKKLIDDSLDLYVVVTFNRYLLEHAGVQSIIAAEFDDPKASFELYRKDGTTHSRSLHAAIAATAKSPPHNLANLRLISQTVINVEDELQREQLHTS